MPIIKSATKRMHQTIKRTKRLKPYRTKMLTEYKKVRKLVEEGKTEEAAKLLSKAFSVIDIAAKKNIIKKQTAARRKSRLAKALDGAMKGPKRVEEKKVAEEKVEEAKETGEKEE